MIALAITIVFGFPCVSAAEKPLEGDPFRGRLLLGEKRCTRCHSVWGHGGLLGPEISTAVAGKSWLDLVGAFWNHTPRMIDAMVAEGYPWPTLDNREMADLLTYLYYLRLFDEPGDSERGSALFMRLRCQTCHSLAGEGGTIGGPLDRFSAYPSPVVLAQAMWNAGPAMQQAQVGMWSVIPTFSGGEMADIQAYIRARGLRSDREVQLLRLPDPARGSAVFRSYRCVACHQPGGVGPDLGKSTLNKTVAEIGGMLWNHSYAMNDWMRSRGISFPRFEDSEMSDLISYIYFIGFIGERGDPVRGLTVFNEKGCASCHLSPDRFAPDLADSPAVRDPVALSAAMWNHSPEMHELMAQRGISWPAFESGDMRDMSAYLREMTDSERKRGQ